MAFKRLIDFVALTLMGHPTHWQCCRLLNGNIISDRAKTYAYKWCHSRKASLQSHCRLLNNNHNNRQTVWNELWINSIEDEFFYLNDEGVVSKSHFPSHTIVAGVQCFFHKKKTTRWRSLTDLTSFMCVTVGCTSTTTSFLTTATTAGVAWAIHEWRQSVFTVYRLLGNVHKWRHPIFIWSLVAFYTT